MTAPIELLLRPETFRIHRLPPGHQVDWARFAAASWYSLTRTEDELSIVATDDVDPGEGECEPGWACLQVAGLLDFALVGILAAISQILADAGISLFVVSTYNTDYVFVKRADVAAAVAALTAAGHRITSV